MKEVERLRREAAHFEDLAKRTNDTLAQRAAKALADEMRQQAEQRAARLRGDPDPSAVS